LQHTSQSTGNLDKVQWERLSLMLSTALNMEPSSINDLATFHQLKNRLVEQQIMTESAYTTRGQMDNLPHRTFPVQLSQNGLEWVVSYGAPGHMVVGKGDSPQAACNDFDHKWLGIQGEDIE